MTIKSDKINHMKQTPIFIYSFTRLLAFTRLLVFPVFLLCVQSNLWAQTGETVRGHVVDEQGLSLPSASVVEIDATNRIISTTVADINGDFSLKIKSPNNRLKITYVSFVAQTLSIGNKREFLVKMKEEGMLSEVVITAKPIVTSGGLSIPKDEVSFAAQRINTKAFEGLQVSSIDDALQGHIAGLDIIGSGNVGTGAQMRIRGIASLSSNANPLVVINGIPREDISLKDVDLEAVNEQQFADLLMLNADDIEEVQVLKDAGATAQYGSRGANGVLEITTKKGVAGPTRVSYSYKYSGSWQPKGMRMLNGDDYTMLMKQAYFNPLQNETATADIYEFNYDKTNSQYENFNNNTDWRKEVTQYGATHDHYLVISGGGERARFRITGGYMTEDGTVIGQKWNRLTSRSELNYNVSDRIRFTAEVAFTYSDNKHNYEQKWGNSYFSLLDIAYKKMPNVGVYAQDQAGNNTKTFYNILRDSRLHTDQKDLWNPVALGLLAQNARKSYDIAPTLRILYDLTERTNEKMLQYEAYVQFNMNNGKDQKFLPKAAIPDNWDSENANRAENGDDEAFGITSENRLTWKTDFGNPDHSLLMSAALATFTSNSNSQDIIAYGSPSGMITDASAGTHLKSVTSSLSQHRSLGMTGRLHYAWKSRYIFDLTLRRDGSTRFGESYRWGTFPGISARWNIAYEPFMAPVHDWLTIWSLRGSWGIVGNQPGKDYMHYSRYSAWSSYPTAGATMRPDNIRLTNLRWEQVKEYNLGTDMELFDGKYTLDGNIYQRFQRDLLVPEPEIPNSSGFTKLPYRNGGQIDYLGWELNFRVNKLAQIGDFSMDVYFNFANNINTLKQLDEDILNAYNKEFDYTNMSDYMQRLEPGHVYGSIYGFRYKGVYTYSIDSYVNNRTINGVNVREAVDGGNATIPAVRDASGNFVTNEQGVPLSTYFNYAYGDNGRNYPFQAGDAIYEDINNDGNIDELDIVYLGNSNPKLSGGFGLTFRYKSLSINAFANFRYGSKIVNQSLRNAESMYNDYNQSITTNWRWRKEGDQTVVPRALHEYGYNSLPSDRYVEDGSFARFKYITLSYNLPTNWIKRAGIYASTLSLAVYNLHCWTNYKGVDPEVSYGGLGISTDNAITPRSKEFTMTLKVTF
jgi:TonB-linked SusC/RagA family outer membrane protein